MALVIKVLLHSAIATATIVTPTFRLVEDILSRDYDKDIRPVVNEKDVVEVTVIPNLFILLAMDQQQETITFSNEFIMIWKDPQLTWNGSEYGYVKEWVKIPEKSVWTPDVIFDQSMSINERLKKEQRLIDLKNDGTLRMSNPSVIEYPCILRTETFPYDVQECDLALSSWNFDLARLMVHTAISNISSIAEQFDVWKWSNVENLGFRGTVNGNWREFGWRNRMRQVERPNSPKSSMPSVSAENPSTTF